MLLMLLFPPFEVIRQHGTFNVGYSFLFIPPGDELATVNIAFLLMQWIMTVIVAGIAWYLLKD